MNPVLSARNVVFRYGDRDILRGVDIDLFPGDGDDPPGAQRLGKDAR